MASPTGDRSAWLKKIDADVNHAHDGTPEMGSRTMSEMCVSAAVSTDFCSRLVSSGASLTAATDSMYDQVGGRCIRSSREPECCSQLAIRPNESGPVQRIGAKELAFDATEWASTLLQEAPVRVMGV